MDNDKIAEALLGLAKKLAVSPPGWKKTVEHMKDHPEIDNPWALAWSESEKGYEPHYSKKAGKRERLTRRAYGLTRIPDKIKQIAKDHGFQLNEDGTVELYQFTPLGYLDFGTPPKKVGSIDEALRQTNYVVEGNDKLIADHKEILEASSKLKTMDLSSNLTSILFRLKSKINNKARLPERKAINEMLAGIIDKAQAGDANGVSSTIDAMEPIIWKLIERWIGQSNSSLKTRKMLLEVKNSLEKGELCVGDLCVVPPPTMTASEKRIRLTTRMAKFLAALDKNLYFKQKGGYVKLTLDKIDGKDAYVVSEMDRSALTSSDKSGKFKETSTMVSVDKLDEKIKRENWKKTTLQEIKAEIGR